MKKNILIFCHSYQPPFFDISNQYVSLFDKEFYQVTVVHLTGKEDESIKQKTPTDDIIFLEQTKKISGGLKFQIIKKMVALCRSKQFELVICQRYKPTYIMALVALFTPIPKIISVVHALGSLKSLSRRCFIYIFARKIIWAGVSQAVRRDLLQSAKKINPKQVIVLPNTINTDAIEQQLADRENACRQFNLEADDFIFGTIGRLHPHKDQRTLIKAFAEIAQEYPSAKLIIIGDGKLASSLKQLAQALHLTDKIIFTGFMAEARRWLKAMDVFILSSIEETFGLVLLEAMIAKLPIIATNIDGIPDVVSDASLLIPAGNPSLLAKTMLKTLQMSANERQQLGLRGYQHVTENFSTKKFKCLFWDALKNASQR